MHNIQNCKCCEPPHSMQNVVRAGNSVVLDGNNPHIRNTSGWNSDQCGRENGVYTMDMWICLEQIKSDSTLPARECLLNKNVESTVIDGVKK